jgi:trans-aconitate methyltransferase
VINFCPGVGTELLARRLSRGRILGVDPSKAQGKMAARRNRAVIVECWHAQYTNGFAAAGFRELRSFAARAERGRSLALVGRRA